jgi:hypothetical protein
VIRRKLKINNSTNKAAQPRSTETTLGERLRGNSIAGNRALSALARLLGRSAARELISENTKQRI